MGRVVVVLAALAAGCAPGPSSGAPPDGAVEVDAGALPCPDPQPGCASGDDCSQGLCLDIPLYECDGATGEWVDSGIVCEGIFVSVEGVLVFRQSVVMTTGVCPALAPREPVVLAIADSGAITADPPVEIVDGVAWPDWEYATVDVTLLDDWAGLTPSVTYHMSVSPSGTVDGQGVATLGDCQAGLALEAALCPTGSTPCGDPSSGWNVACANSIVTSDDLAQDLFCAPGDPTPACEVGGFGGATPVATCPTGCADTATHWFATLDAYQAFDPTTLCAP